MLNSSRGAQASSQAKETCIFGGIQDQTNSRNEEDDELFGDIAQSMLQTKNSLKKKVDLNKTYGEKQK